jgi:hypothetical protein
MAVSGDGLTNHLNTEVTDLSMKHVFERLHRIPESRFQNTVATVRNERGETLVDVSCDRLQWVAFANLLKADSCSMSSYGRRSTFG